MTRTKVTIVSITYNHEKYIAQALDSFIMQKTNFPFEVIISDDASIDKTAEIIRKYAETYPEIIKPIFRKKNLGVCENYIQTLALAKSEYVILCDGDDYFSDPLKLQRQVDFLNSNTDCSICFHPVQIFFEDNSQPTEIFPTPEYRLKKNIFTLNDILYNNFMQTNSVMYRWIFVKENIEDIFPKDILPCDWFLHILHAQKGKIGYINKTMANYRRHKDGIWWKSIHSVDDFHYLYGISELNFYLNVYKKILNNDKKYYESNIVSFSKTLINIYLQKNDFKKIEKVLSMCPEACTNNNCFPNEIYYYEKKLKQLRKQRMKFIIAISVLCWLLVCAITYILLNMK